jgi:hypothetical protein
MIAGSAERRKNILFEAIKNGLPEGTEMEYSLYEGASGRHALLKGTR